MRENKIHFVVESSKGNTVLTAPLEFDLFQRDITLTVAEWGRILGTLIPLRKHITDIATTGNDCVVTCDDDAIPDVNRWMEKKKRPITIGKANGSKITIELKSQREHRDEAAGRWDTVATASSAKIEQYFKFKPTKKYTTIEFVGGDTFKFGSLARHSDEHTHLTKATYRLLKSSCEKMQRLSNELRFEQRKNQLRVSVDIRGGMILQAYFGVE